MNVLGIPTVTLKASAEAICLSPFSYTLFQGNKTDTLTLEGIAWVHGSMHSNNKMLLEGLVGVDGNVEAVNGVTKEWFVWVGGNTNNNAGNMTMPDLTSEVASSVSPSKTYTGPTNFKGTDIINGSIYVKESSPGAGDGNLTINGATVDLNGFIMADNNITINGITFSGGQQAGFYSRNGNISLTGATVTFGDSSAGSLIYAPNGKVDMSGIGLVYGRIVANSLNIDQIGIYWGNYPITCLPSGSTLSSHVKLIN
jgi:hypothetical protein